MRVKWTTDKILNYPDLRSLIREIVEKSTDIGIPRVRLIEAISKEHKEYTYLLKQSDYSDEEIEFFEKVDKFIGIFKKELLKTIKENSLFEGSDDEIVLEKFSKIFKIFYLVYIREKILKKNVEKYGKQIGVRKREIDDIYKILDSFWKKYYNAEDYLNENCDLRIWYYKNNRNREATRVVFFTTIWAIDNFDYRTNV